MDLRMISTLFMITYIATHCIAYMPISLNNLCPHSDDPFSFRFLKPGSILVMKKMILKVVSSNKTGELRNQLKFYRNDNSKPKSIF